nr:MAG TPA: hypothetical protein [Caudoviricetes sp.]
MLENPQSCLIFTNVQIKPSRSLRSLDATRIK